jgi:hypothetical protein
LSPPKRRKIKPRRIPSNIHEEGPLDAPEFLQGEIELVLALEGSQTLEHRRWQHSAGFQRGDQAQDVVPGLADDIFLDAAANDRAGVREEDIKAAVDRLIEEIDGKRDPN